MLYIDRLDEPGRRDVMRQLREFEVQALRDLTRARSDPDRTLRILHLVTVRCVSRSSATTDGRVPSLLACPDPTTRSWP